MHVFRPVLIRSVISLEYIMINIYIYIYIYIPELLKVTRKAIILLIDPY